MPIRRRWLSACHRPPRSATSARRTSSQTGSESISTPSMSKTTASTIAVHDPRPAGGPSCRRARPGGGGGRSAAEDLLLLRLELLVAEDALVPELGQLLQLGDLIAHVVRRRGGG